MQKHHFEDGVCAVGGNTIGFNRNDLGKLDDIKLVIKSPTGLFEREIDLKTVKSGEI